jgi:hypothetical protein
VERSYTVLLRRRTRFVLMRAMSNKRIMAAILLTIAFLATNGSGQPDSPIKAIATREDIMHHLVIPNAQIVWGAVGTISTLQGVEERRPKTDDEWFNIESSAITLMEAGNLLMMEGRAIDKGHWIDRARALREAGDLVRQAAKNKDATALFDRGGDLFDSCQGCHFEYRFTKDPNTIRTH